MILRNLPKLINMRVYEGYVIGSLSKGLKYYVRFKLYMSFAVGKTANGKYLDSKFADSKYLDGKRQMKITIFWP